ncbi:hypothetical protein CIG75_11860 [Tumebacillus algifaecis]|uniref:Nucleotidyl transferase AbiEii/AbiGii toxin family protein n=1 Tax=Tumebacillus algifaecis TaxID=1214604 RepID=A0A223D2K7_9BACL|nr:hypothetical protein [Tumebacillus algifaecis]ASS75614.1 hypothetical protein CIG75_11860 [Tumebacillus algifaecis]
MLDGALLSIAKAFTNQEIIWGVGGSRLLLAHGIVHEARDLDLLIAESSVLHADRVLQTLGAGGVGVVKAPFCSRYFAQYRVQHADVDLIGGYRIAHEAGVYEQAFSAASLSGSILLDRTEIPLSALEDWYVTYQLYPAKAEKAAQIEAYFVKNGSRRPELLRRALQGELPERVRVRIQRLLVQLS